MTQPVTCDTSGHDSTHAWNYRGDGKLRFREKGEGEVERERESVTESREIARGEERIKNETN